MKGSRIVLLEAQAQVKMSHASEFQQSQDTHSTPA